MPASGSGHCPHARVSGSVTYLVTPAHGSAIRAARGQAPAGAYRAIDPGPSPWIKVRGLKAHEPIT
jgi:hypothetical protein